MIYAYKRGNGNEGNYFRNLVELSETDCPYLALQVLVPNDYVNDYISGKRVRRHIIKTIEIDGEAEFGIHAMVYDGPDGETEFGAAYITAELIPDGGSQYDGEPYPLRDLLDAAAWRSYRKMLRLQSEIQGV